MTDSPSAPEFPIAPGQQFRSREDPAAVVVVDELAEDGALVVFKTVAPPHVGFRFPVEDFRRQLEPHTPRSA